MGRLIEKIWNDDYSPSEKHAVCLEKIKRCNDELYSMEMEFTKGLSKEKKAELEKIVDKHYELLEYLLLDAYFKGVKFGGEIISEILKE